MVAKVTIIIPVYKVEKYVARCAEALMKQTLQEVEYIFVNDGTPDNSISVLQSVLEKYPQRLPNVKIVEHEQNKGLPAARNTGLSVASGEYIFHCDSDDYVEDTLLERLYTAAKERDADIAWCDWCMSFGTTEKCVIEPSFDEPFDALKSLLVGPMTYNVWNKLVKRSLYLENDIVFPAGYSMGEDMTMIMLHACARKVIYVPGAFYHYVKYNTNAMSKGYTDEHLVSLKYNVDRVSTFLHQKYGDKLERELSFMKLGIKSAFLVTSADSKMYRLWKEWFPEANAYIGKNKNTILRIRFLEWCASKGLFVVVRLYYWIVIKFLYSIKYNLRCPKLL